MQFLKIFFALNTLHILLVIKKCALYRISLFRENFRAHNMYLFLMLAVSIPILPKNAKLKQLSLLLSKSRLQIWAILQEIKALSLINLKGPHELKQPQTNIYIFPQWFSVFNWLLQGELKDKKILQVSISSTFIRTNFLYETSFQQLFLVTCT